MFCDTIEFISWGDLCDTIEVYQLLVFLRIHGVYQFGGSLLVREFVQVCEFDANPRAREPEIPACRLDCHVLIGLSRSLSVVWPFGNFLKSFGFIVFNAL